MTMSVLGRFFHPYSIPTVKKAGFRFQLYIVINKLKEDFTDTNGKKMNYKQIYNCPSFSRESRFYVLYENLLSQ